MDSNAATIPDSDPRATFLSFQQSKVEKKIEKARGILRFKDSFEEGSSSRLENLDGDRDMLESTRFDRKESIISICLDGS